MLNEETETKMCKTCLSDEEILAGESSAKAFEILSERYTKRVIAAARSFSHGAGVYDNIDDFIQEGLIALFRAIETYDEKKGAKFSTYAYTCIRNRISDAAKKGAFRTPEEAEQNGFTPETAAMDNEFRKMLSSAAKNLTKLEQSVLQLRRDDVPYSDIAKILGISEKSVDNAFYRAKRKLRKFFNS
jgi:RNA polymerase sporulation-specific sigma factor